MRDAFIVSRLVWFGNEENSAIKGAMTPKGFLIPNRKEENET